MIKNWQGKTVAITGATTGIGRALSFELASRGAIIYVTGLSLDECTELSEKIKAQQGQAHPLVLDVNNNDNFQQVLNEVQQAHGQLDVLINNAGLLYVGEFDDMEPSGIHKLIQVNLNAVTVGSLYAYQLMKAQGSGTILNISSMGGFSPTPTMAVYSATKHAVLGLTKALALEGKAYNIQCRAACFGLIDTPLFDTAEMKKGNKQTVYGMLPVKPLSPQEAAKACVDGLASSKRLIFVPFYAKLTWWIYRLFPALLDKGGLDTINKFRALTEKT